MKVFIFNVLLTRNQSKYLLIVELFFPTKTTNIFFYSSLYKFPYLHVLWNVYCNEFYIFDWLVLEEFLGICFQSWSFLAELAAVYFQDLRRTFSKFLKKVAMQ